ncbi:MFS transporter [Sediminispirochaeta smaragdinae]|uniref:Major facilitator superfamily MFS_1 n=1 Tax=Sediminispirochaeta smaragdinae (strain DSM 11293 / JCM 15392 / SEBR 4228) TaxID=573413 RepID=E1R4R2_SEDSS|nr:MFS transporter [Sediminispirochaeta smaragdinae]ADK82150.1 major facilitator superfamily MFS_1 [Sediminispirochaeta smaragdinae DSM 11293]
MALSGRPGQLLPVSLFRTYRGLPKSVYALFFARIINSIGSFVHPFMTLFLTDRLGLGEAAAGRYLLLAALAFVPGSLIAGKLTDSIGRKRVLVFSQIAAAACFIPCGFLDHSPMLPWFLILSQFFSGGVYPVSQAITTDLTTPKNRQAAFGLIYLGTNIGFAVGPLIAGFLYRNHAPWLFFGDAGTTFLSVIFIILLVTESRPTEEQISAGYRDESDERSEVGSTLVVLLRRPFLFAFLFLMPFLNMVYSQMNFSLPLYLLKLFPDNGTVYFGTLMTVNALTVTLLTTGVVALTRDLRPIIAVALAALLYGLGFGGLYITRSFSLILVCAVIWTLGEILSFTHSSVYVANHTPITHRGRFNAFFPILLGAGNAFGPLFAGPLIEKHGISAIWPLAGSFALFISLLFLLLAEIERRVRK